MVEILRGGPPDARWRPPRWAAVLGLALALAAVIAVVVQGRHLPERPPGPAPAASPPRSGSPAEFSCAARPAGRPSPRPAAPVAALMLGTPIPGDTLDRWDRTARSGPWTVVVRRHDGSLGRHSAVVTFPVRDRASGQRVPVGDVFGWRSGTTLSWPIGGARARVHGELGPAELVAIAAATRVVDGRPVVSPPAGFRVAGSGPYRSPHVREVRYDGSRVDARLGGLVYTGVAAIGGFEDQLLTRVVSCGLVAGQPAVVSAVGGGSGTLAWQVAPGLVGYVGYSGGGLSGSTLAALVQLAGGTRTIDDRQWLATAPQVVEQDNDFS